MQVLDGRLKAELFGRHVKERALAIGAKGHLTRVLFGIGDELLGGLGWEGGTHHQGQKVGGEQGNGCEVFLGVVHHFLISQRHNDHVAPLAASDGVAIGLGLLDQTQTQLPRGARAVIDHHGLPQLL